MSKDKGYHKKIILGLVFILIISVIPLTQGTTQIIEKQTTLTYSFECPTIKTTAIDENTYDRVLLSEGLSASNSGEPNIPSKGAYILLPPNSKVDSIEIQTGERFELGTEFRVEPVGEPIPITNNVISPKLSENKVIYSSDEFFPGRLYTNVGIYNFRGYQILVLLIHPVQYNPVTGELFYYDEIKVNVKTSYVAWENNLFRGLAQDQKEVEKKVDNPEVTLQYKNEMTPLPLYDSYDLLILTTDSLKSGFEPLKAAHDAKGLDTVIKTLTDVGSSNLENIRNYIIDAYNNWGIEYVLIGGDSGVVPAPILWVSGMDENTTYYEDYMPADLYFACLDGPYNYDGDDKWGEPNDGTGGGDVDLIAEVYVGRACVDNAADVNNFVTKTVAYINKNPDDEYLDKVCLAAEYLGDYGIASYGGTYMDQLEDGSTDDGYTTVGIPTSNYTITKLYDSPSYYWDYTELVNIINNDVHIINHLGHASYDYNMKMYSSDVGYLTNDKTCFIYSQGCMAGGFDDPWGYDCIAEEFTAKTSHAAFAGIWNARYGFFWSYSTDGDSQRLHRQFWDAVFGEGIPEIGRANHDSKEDNLAIIGRSCIRWCYYETNLFGDPALSFYEVEQPQPNNPPNTPSIDGKTTGNPDTEYAYTVVSTDPDGDNVYYYIDWGDNTSTDWVGPYASGEEVAKTHKWSTKGVYVIKVKAKDIFDEESEIATLQVTMPRSKGAYYTILQKLIERYNFIFHIFKQMFI